MPCYSPLKGWKDEETGGIVFRPGIGAEEMEVACGQCLGCRLDHSRMWALRIVHESAMHQSGCGSCFVTLTYRDIVECDTEQLENKLHVPSDWSLHKSHFQKFMKRLRKHFSPQKIRFFHCGEYGNKCKHGIDLELVGCPLCNVGRPHYHAALFGWYPDDPVAYKTKDGYERFTSPTLERIWKYGFVDVGELNFDTAAYIARYNLKKVTGVKASDHYMQVDFDGECSWVEPEYITMSRRPGIGRDFYEKYKDDMFPSDMTPMVGDGKPVHGVPRYYEEIFKCEDPLTLEEIKEVRQKFREEHGEEYTPQRLMQKYKVKKAEQKLFKERSL